MSYSSLAVANEFLDLAKQKGEQLTHLKLQKLLYFAQGWYLAITDRPLFNEQIEAWKYGPVVRTVYGNFRDYGNDPITENAQLYLVNSGDWDFDSWESKVPVLEDTEKDSTKLQYDRDFLKLIYNTFSQYSAVQLSNLTHQPGTPWHKVAKQYPGEIPRGTDIPMDSIKAYFNEIKHNKQTQGV